MEHLRKLGAQAEEWLGEVGVSLFFIAFTLMNWLVIRVGHLYLKSIGWL